MAVLLLLLALVFFVLYGFKVASTRFDYLGLGLAFLTASMLVGAATPLLGYFHK